MKIGFRIKKLRMQQKITLKELGEKTSLTTSFLSQLERDLTSPSFSSLEKIADALNTTMIYFFEGEEHKKWVIIKRGTVKKPIDKKNKLFCETLASGFLNLKMQPHIFTIGKGGELDRELIYPEGEGFGMVLKGGLELACSDEKLVLEEGDSIYCHSTRRLQKVTNTGNKDAELLWIIFRTG